jgi:SAM-dependent methyltransferase
VAYARIADTERDFWRELRALIDAGAQRIVDVGGGARPVLARGQLERYGVDYLVLDESPEELESAGAGYARAQASILDRAAIAALVRERGSFDVVLSRWTAEHVRDGRRFHESVYSLLRPGGTAIHLFPTLYALPFLVNRLLPRTLASGLLFRVCPDRTKKFTPYYSWCRGPSGRQLRRLESVGFEVVSYTGYYGHVFYERLAPLAGAQRAFNSLMLAHPLPAMTSFALVVLRRPL